MAGIAGRFIHIRLCVFLDNMAGVTVNTEVLMLGM